jgi:mRNA-degrading endonuclease toxin of MazEF toxin-antitoxin module
MVIHRGDVLDVAISLSGHATSGGEHSSVAVSTDDFNARNGLVVVLSSRRPDSRVKPPYAFSISNESAYQHYAGRGLEMDRVITPTLAATFKSDSVGLVMGHLGPEFFSGSACERGFGADDSLRVQFQLPGRMRSLAKLYGSAARDVASIPAHLIEVRLSIWAVEGDLSPWLIVSNNTHNARTGYVQAMELTPEPEIEPTTPLAVEDTTVGDGRYFISATLVSFRKRESGTGDGVLRELLGHVQSSAVSAVDSHLMTIFGLTPAA